MQPLRFGLLGYRSDEVKIKQIVTGEAVKVRIQNAERTISRSVEQVSLGCHFNGAACPHPDTADVKTLEQGVSKRMGRKMPLRTTDFLPRLRKHTKEAIEHFKLTPIEADYPFLFQEWLDQTNYEDWRKKELIKIHDDFVDLLERNDDGELRHFRVKLFMKAETYMEFKNGRGIYAREDVAKVVFGPFFKEIEKRVYFDPETGEGIKHFIKHVPVDKRADFIMEEVYMEAFRAVCTDYSSLEAHFDPDFMDNCEFVLYDHMLSANPHGKAILEIMREVLMGVNRIVNKYLVATIIGRRMSGEMNTSLGNGWTNLMLFSMWFIEAGGSFDELRGVIEGDDGLFCIPTNFLIPKEEFFAAWGCIIKIIITDDISCASFCGLIFDPDDRKIIADPFKILANFGYTSSRYACAKDSKLKSLLRAKAMSCLVQYSGCPIISVLSKKILELTRSHDVRAVISKERDEWRRGKLIYGMKNFKNFVNSEIGIKTRLLFEQMYGIPVSVQISIENQISKMDRIQVLNFPELLPLFPTDCLEYFDSYNCVYDRKLGKSVVFDCPKMS